MRPKSPFTTATLLKSYLQFTRDYAARPELDRYSDADIDDEQYDDMTGAARRRAEAAMARRDLMEERGGRRGARAARRSRMEYLQDEDEEDGLELERMKRRTRRQYDEVRDLDDMDGAEDVCYGLMQSERLADRMIAGDPIGAIERYQGQVDLGMDRYRSS